MGVSVGVVLVVVVTQVPRSSLGLVSAIGRHGRPAELERQQSEQDDGEEATHGQESSGYRVCLDTTKPTRLWGFTTSRRGHARRCGSVAWRMTRSYSQRLRPDRLGRGARRRHRGCRTSRSRRQCLPFGARGGMAWPAPRPSAACSWCCTGRCRCQHPGGRQFVTFVVAESDVVAVEVVDGANAVIWAPGSPAAFGDQGLDVRVVEIEQRRGGQQGVHRVGLACAGFRRVPAQGAVRSAPAG